MVKIIILDDSALKGLHLQNQLCFSEISLSFYKLYLDAKFSRDFIKDQF